MKTRNLYSLGNSKAYQGSRQRAKNNNLYRTHSKAKQNRWLISYADILTLLFVFFVVLYSISSLNDNMYDDLHSALEHNFNKQSITSSDAVKAAKLKDKIKTITAKYKNNLHKVKDKVSSKLSHYLEDDTILLSQSSNWLRVELGDNLVFTEDSAKLNQESFLLLKEIALALTTFDNHILVEGFTDNLALESKEYASNWELSAARSASVVRALNTYGVDSDRLAAVGYGPAHPIADNETTQGRAQNRRVSILINKVVMQDDNTSSKTKDKLDLSNDNFTKDLTVSGLMASASKIEETKLDDGSIRFSAIRGK